MNICQRKELQKISMLIRDAMDRLECVRDKEEEYCCGMPEELQESEEYEQASECVKSLDEMLDLDTVLIAIDEAQG